MGATLRASEIKIIERDKKEEESALMDQARIIEEIERCMDEQEKKTKEEIRRKEKDVSGPSYTQMNPIEDKPRKEAMYILFTEEKKWGFIPL